MKNVKYRMKKSQYLNTGNGGFEKMPEKNLSKI